MHPMSQQECAATARDANADGLAPWIAAGWASLIFLGAGSVLVDRLLPADTTMAALDATAAVQAAEPAPGPLFAP